MTSDVMMRIKVTGRQATQEGVSTTPPSAGLAETGTHFSGAALYAGLFMLLLAAGLVWFFWWKRRRQHEAAAARSNTQRIKGNNHTLFWAVALAGAGVTALLVGAASSTTQAEPVAELRVASPRIDVTIDQDRQKPASSDTTLSFGAHSQAGYAVEAKLADHPDALSAPQIAQSGLQLAIKGGEATDVTPLSADKPVRLKTAKQPGKATLPVTLSAQANEQVSEGEYTVAVRFTITPIADGQAQDRPGSQTPPRQPRVRQLPDYKALMSADTTVGELIQINSFSERNDGVKVTYRIAATLPTGGMLRHVAMPIKGGKYAVPELSAMRLPAANPSPRVNEFLEVAQTYAAAGRKLIWDSKRSTPLYTSSPIHKTQRQPYALTCSSFVGMALSAWKFQNTTYVADRNTKSYNWGTNFERPAGTPAPFGAWRMFKWLYWQGRVTPHQAGVEDYQPGDLLFFSQQSPEGPQTTGHFFMNVYHVAIYMGGNKVIHSYSPSSGNGVVVQPFSQGLKKNLSFVARPQLNGS